MTFQAWLATASWKTLLAISTPTMVASLAKAVVAFISDSFWLSADTPHHMRPAGTMMPKDQEESIPSANWAPAVVAFRRYGFLRPVSASFYAGVECQVMAVDSTGRCNRFVESVSGC